MRNKHKKISVGDLVMYRSNFGTGDLDRVKVTGLSVLLQPRDKYSVIDEDIDSVTYGQVQENRVIFMLDNNSWCYADQVDAKIDNNKLSLIRSEEDNNMY